MFNASPPCTGRLALLGRCSLFFLLAGAGWTARADGLSATWAVSAWSGGYTANLTIKNSGPTAVNGWIAQFTSSQQETSVWNADVAGPAANIYTLTPASWTSVLAANGGSAAIGFTFDGSPPQTPTNFIINGQALVLNGPDTGTGPGGGTGSGTGSGTGTGTGSGPSTGGSGGSGPGGSPTGPTQSSISSGTINFHYYYGASPTSPEDSLTLAGDNYTDLIMSNLIAGVMYGHLLQEFTPGIQFNKDYLYGSIFGQLLQENIATEYYDGGSGLIDSSAAQQAVMEVGQGGPYQINNYAADMVAGTYAPGGFSLINYVAIQKNIGFTLAQAGSQYMRQTPASFNDKYYGPMLTAYFHFNDYRALQYIGGTDLDTPWSPTSHSWTPQWQPALAQSIAAFKGLSGSQLDILLNVAYNAGYYASLFQADALASANSTSATVASFNSFGNAWAGDSYHQYPYQVRGYLDQLYDTASPASTDLSQSVTAGNHVAFDLLALSDVFGRVFQTLAYVNGSGTYANISYEQATGAFARALKAAALTTSNTLDLSNAAERAEIFSVLEQAIGNLESDLNTSFSATTSRQL